MRSVKLAMCNGVSRVWVCRMLGLFCNDGSFALHEYHLHELAPYKALRQHYMQSQTSSLG